MSASKHEEKNYGPTIIGIQFNNLGIYKDVSILISTIEEIQSTDNKALDKLPIELRHALNDFHKKLKTATAKYLNSANSYLEKEEQYKKALIEEACSAIYDHYPTLMAAPGFLNQLLAHINNFIQHYFPNFPIIKEKPSQLQETLKERFFAVKEYRYPEEGNDAENKADLEL
jgi:tRNA-dihydrouridine synthase